MINQNGRPQAVSGCLRRSAEQVGVPCQGEGRGFESRRPLHGNPLLSRGVLLFCWLKRDHLHLQAAYRPRLPGNGPRLGCPAAARQGQAASAFRWIIFRQCEQARLGRTMPRGQFMARGVVPPLHMRISHAGPVIAEVTGCCHVREGVR